MKRTWDANFCFGLVCKVGCEGPKVVIFLSPAWVVSHVKRTLGANFCFGLVCIVVWKVQKEFYSFISMGCHMNKTLEINFCFGLVCIVVWKVQKEFHSFISMG